MPSPPLIVANWLQSSQLGTNKTASLPAKPIMGRLSSETRARLSKTQLSQPYYVKVNKDGLPGEAFLDESCTQKATDRDVVVLIDNFRFTPALDKGKPVDTLAKLKLDEARPTFD